jgi:hypothetical protein
MLDMFCGLRFSSQGRRLPLSRFLTDRTYFPPAIWSIRKHGNVVSVRESVQVRLLYIEQLFGGHVLHPYKPKRRFSVQVPCALKVPILVLSQNQRSAVSSPSVYTVNGASKIQLPVDRVFNGVDAALLHARHCIPPVMTG